MKTIPAFIIVILVGISARVYAADDPVVQEPAGYRMNDYNAPVPMTVTGANVIESAQDLHTFLLNSQRAILIDIYPAPRKPDNFPENDLWIEPTRETIKDAIWLANTGMGFLPVELEKLLQDKLEAFTLGDKNHAIVMFCEPDCWHSWNAVKRSVSYGYSNIYWYRQGVTGWRHANLPLEQIAPVRP